MQTKHQHHKTKPVCCQSLHRGKQGLATGYPTDLLRGEASKEPTDIHWTAGWAPLRRTGEMRGVSSPVVGESTNIQGSNVPSPVVRLWPGEAGVD